MPPTHSPGSCAPAFLPAGETISGVGLHVLQLAAFDACTNTRAQTTVSKSFDAISQQSVKQKTFVGLHTVWKTVSKQRDADISGQEQGLFVPRGSVGLRDWIQLQYGLGKWGGSEGQHHALRKVR